MQAVIDLVNQAPQLAKTVLDLTLGVMGSGNGNGGTNNTTQTKKQTQSPPIEKPSSIVRKLRGGNGFPISRNWVRLAGISGACAVALGAYGAHQIENSAKIDEERKRSFRSANLYHFIGTFGLVASSLARFPVVSGTLMSVGTLVFCGSCYYFAITGETNYKRFAPYGGTTLIAAWLSLIL